MSSDQTVPATSSRRAMLAAAVGGVGAVAIQAIGAPARARAADGDAVRAGQVTTAVNPTQIHITSQNIALIVRANATTAIRAFGGSTAIEGRSGGTGVTGLGDRIGVRGVGVDNGVVGHTHSSTGNGVSGTATGNGHGVFGTNGHPDGFGVFGRNLESGNFGALGGPNGVEGQAIGAIGVNGRGTGSGAIGVNGTAVASSGTGVYGRNVASGNYGRVGTNNAGVVGHAFQGTAVTATAHGPAAGLRVTGKNYFDRAGSATILNGQSSLVVAASLDKSTLVLALLLEDRPGVWVRAVVTDDFTGTFTILLNTSVSGNTKVAYFLIG